MGIAKAYTRIYTDNGDRKAYVEWHDGSRTEGKLYSRRLWPRGAHMQSLFVRAERDGVKIEHQTW